MKIVSLLSLSTSFLVFAFATNAFAASLIVRNSTPAEIRIVELRSKCDGSYITEEAPKFLQPGEEFAVEVATVVVHTYKICGSGYCSASALGMKEDREYVLNVELDDGWLIHGVSIPNHWVGNLDCPR